MQIGSRPVGGVVTITVTTGGTGYASAPVVAISGGSGTGASAFAHMAGTLVESVAIFNGGSSYVSVPTISFSGGSGTSAAAVATIAPLTVAPLSFFKGRYGDVYGVDGTGRGFRWNGVDASVEQIGIMNPATGPAVTAQTAVTNGYIAAIQMVNNGGGYSSPPAVTITGGGATEQAAGRALLANGRVTGVRLTSPGKGYSSTPSVDFTGGLGSGATFALNVQGQVYSVEVVSGGTGYTAANESQSVECQSVTAAGAGATLTFTIGMAQTDWTHIDAGGGVVPITIWSSRTQAAIASSGLTGPMTLSKSTWPTVVFGNLNGLTGHLAVPSVGEDGRIESIQIQAGGTGATTTGITASISGGSGTGASLRVRAAYSVTSVTITSGGTNYYADPFVTVIANAADFQASPATIAVTANATGVITAATVLRGGMYEIPPTAKILDTAAVATATVRQRMRGEYKCCTRYIDDTPADEAGPRASSISFITTLDASDTASSITWTLSHSGLEPRVAAVELWRSTADQAVVVYRVATILATAGNFSGTYADTLTDDELQDSSRSGFALMPITLPSGQLNARRFGVPPSEFSLAVMFQDRAWMAGSSQVGKQNALRFSEVDEPESVPAENELMLQENTLVADSIVGLLPFGSQLIIAQQGHLYTLSYVAQPVIDASMQLVSYRGALSATCMGVLGGVAIIVDSWGMYAFDGNQEEALSVPIDNYWQDGVIDFSKKTLFHIQCERLTKTARFFYCRSGDSAPVRALCYCVATKAWWEEEYASAVYAGSEVLVAGKVVPLWGSTTGGFLKEGGLTDSGVSVAYKMQTGNGALVDEKGERTVAVLYDPTATTATLNASLYYNNSATPRANAIASNRGDGFVTVTGSTAATLNMADSRSALGAANGFAQAYYAGRPDERSAGADRHVAVQLAGTQSADRITIFGLAIKGAQ